MVAELGFEPRPRAYEARELTVSLPRNKEKPPVALGRSGGYTNVRRIGPYMANSIEMLLRCLVTVNKPLRSLALPVPLTPDRRLMTATSQTSKAY